MAEQPRPAAPRFDYDPRATCTCWWGVYVRHGGGTDMDITRFDPDCPEHGDAPEDDGTLGPCGCVDYHMADCDGSRAMTKDDYLDLYAGSYPDDWPDDEGGY